MRFSVNSVNLRKDYILERYTYISEVRAQRPHDFKQQDSGIERAGVCPFCPGNEALTPSEIGRYPLEGPWQIRWFPNKFSALSLKRPSSRKAAKEDLFIEDYPFGQQEIIVETPDHKRQFAELGIEEISNIIGVYKLRIEELSQMRDIEYVMIFKNEGSASGASIAHSHSQVMAISRIPPLVAEEFRSLKNFSKCPFCDILKQEEKGPRLVFRNEAFVAFCPFAPRYNFEVWILPRKHLNNLVQLKQEENFYLAQALKAVLSKLRELNASYSFYLHYLQDPAFHFHFEILPRLNIHAGFELGSGNSIVTISPEAAAQFYRTKKYAGQL